MAKKYIWQVTLSEKQKRMIEDDTFFDVNEEDVLKLLQKMAAVGYSREDIIPIRVKYWAYFNDPEKKLMEDLGVNYENHTITKTPGTGNYYINGFTPHEWKMLTDDDYCPKPHKVRAFISKCIEAGDKSSVEILREKYGSYINLTSKDSAISILEMHGLPPDTKYRSISILKIDGMSFYRWKLLNLDGYKPSNVGTLISTLRQLEKNRNFEAASIIEQKYFDLLHADDLPPPSEEELLAAEELFFASFPYNPGLRKSIERDRARRSNHKL